MGRPAKKRKYAEAKAETKGRLQAEREYKKNKPVEETLKEYVDNIMKSLDPFKTAAILGMTYIIHGTIVGTPALMDKVKVLQHPEFLALGAFGVVAAQYLPLPEGALKKIIEETPDWFIWLESFTIAYIVCVHAGSLIGLLDKGIGSLTSLMLGA